jgi:hypothetical protein
MTGKGISPATGAEVREMTGAGQAPAVTKAELADRIEKIERLIAEKAGTQ